MDACGAAVDRALHPREAVDRDKERTEICKHQKPSSLSSWQDAGNGISAKSSAAVTSGTEAKSESAREKCVRSDHHRTASHQAKG